MGRWTVNPTGKGPAALRAIEQLERSPLFTTTHDADAVTRRGGAIRERGTFAPSDETIERRLPVTALSAILLANTYSALLQLR